MHTSTAILALAASLATAQRPADTPICDYYTTALLKNNTAANQYTLLTLLVNTVVIGNYTQPNVGVAVPGILAPGTFNGVAVNLLPYFDGELVSSNRNNTAKAINFLDGGGAAPLMKNMPANSTTSNQYFLLTHLYSFFGALLGCSMIGKPNTDFPAYTGRASMYTAHKFMDLSAAEVGYFVSQVAMAGASFGVAKDDLTAVGSALNNAFGMRCSAPAEIIPGQGAQLQAICIDNTCPLAANSVCAQYDTAVEPMNATMTMGTNGTATPSSTTGSGGAGASSTSTPVTAGASTPQLSFAALLGAFIIFLL